jgi:hypothetical protein
MNVVKDTYEVQRKYLTIHQRLIVLESMHKFTSVSKGTENRCNGNTVTVRSSTVSVDVTISTIIYRLLLSLSLLFLLYNILFGPWGYFNPRSLRLTYFREGYYNLI